MSVAYDADQLWTKSASPYVVTSTVVLFPGYVLTIEPGVTVLFDNNTQLIIRGEIIAAGTKTDSIVFASNDGGAGTGVWDGIQIATNQGGKGIFDYIKVSQASSAIDVECCNAGGPVNVNHSRFFKNDCVSGSYAGWDMLFDNCLFEDNKTVFGAADKIVTNCVFRNNEYGLNSTERIDVIKCTFTGHSKIALYGGRGLLENCIIKNNKVGVKGFFEGFTIDKSCIVDNDTGIILSNYDGSVAAIANSNIINRQMNVINTAPYNVPITFNWWGTTDTVEILKKIHDGFDDPMLGLVIQPFYNDSIGFEPSVLTVGVDATVQDDITGTKVVVSTSDQPSGRLAVAEGSYVIQDDNIEPLKIVDLAPSSDLADGLTSAEITMYYGDYDLAAVNENEIGLFYLKDGEWVDVGGEVDTVLNKVSATVTHFSTYAVLAVDGYTNNRLKVPDIAYKTGFSVIKKQGGRLLDIHFTLADESNVSIDMYSLKGRLVSNVVNSRFSSGKHLVSAEFSGRPLASGIYVVRMLTGSTRIIHSFVLAD
jgi:hypothetical protein